jgi:N-acetylglucosamine-6-sulfatase
MMHRLKGMAARLLLAAMGVSGAVAAAVVPPQAEPALPPRPNIVVLMVDDLDVGSFERALGAGLLPNLAQVFAAGTRFTESFATEALCCPSRSTFLTGLYPHNHGVVRNGGAHGGFGTFLREFGDNNVATWLQGPYRTGHVGKFLNGYNDGTVVPPGWDDWQGLVDPSTYCMYGYTVSNNGHPVTHGNDPVRDYQTDVLAGLAEDFILDRGGAGGGRPMFLSVAPLAPHREICIDGIRPAPRHRNTPPFPLPKPPSFNEADMSDKPAWMRVLPLRDEAEVARLYNQRIASLRAVDDLLGRVVRALASVQQLDRTAFLFTSDNGYLLGLHRWESKVLVYEESIRVPLLARVPGVAGPRNSAQLVLNNDLAPTIAALARVTPGLKVDGRSLLPLLEGTAGPWRRRFVAEYPPVPAPAPGGDPDLAGVRPNLPPFFAVRTGVDGDLTRLVYSETLNADAEVTARELYDLRVDPFQIASRHRDPAYAARRLRLKAHLDALKACGGGSCQGLEE